MRKEEPKCPHFQFEMEKYQFGAPYWSSVIFLKDAERGKGGVGGEAGFGEGMKHKGIIGGGRQLLLADWNTMTANCWEQ